MMALLKEIFRDWRGQCAAFAVWMAAPVAILAFAIFQPWVSFDYLSRDPLVVAEIAPECCRSYFGALSNMGVVFWVLAAGASLAAAAAFWRVSHLSKAPGGAPPQPLTESSALFFLGAAFLSLLLGGDDLFSIHEWFGAEFAAGEKIVYGLFGLLAAAFVVIFRRQVLAEAPLFLVSAAGLLAVSVGADIASDDLGADAQYVVEDGFKFLGVAAWSAYFLRRAYLDLGKELARRNQ